MGSNCSELSWKSSPWRSSKPSRSGGCGVRRGALMRSPTFCIYGAGAIGGTIAARLARTDAAVSIVARGETLVALKMHGLRLISDGQIVEAHVQAVADPSELGPQD